MAGSFVIQFREDTGDEFKDFSDEELAKAFHSKYEQDTGLTADFGEFSKEFGLVAPEPEPEKPVVDLDQPGAPNVQLVTGAPFEHTAEGIDVPRFTNEQLIQDSQLNDTLGAVTSGTGEDSAEVLNLREKSEAKWAEKLPGLPRSVHESLASEALGIDPGAATQGELQSLRKSIQEQGQTPAEALRTLWGPELTDAPRRLRQAAGSDVAVPSVSLGIAQTETGQDDLGNAGTELLREDQTLTGGFLRGRGNFLGPDITPEDIETQIAEGQDSTWEAVKKAYNNIPEDFLLQYYGLSLGAMEDIGTDLAVAAQATPEEIRDSQIKQQQRIASAPHLVLMGISPEEVDPIQPVIPQGVRQAVAQNFFEQIDQEMVAMVESQVDREPIFVEPGSVAFYASSGVSSLANTLPAVTAGVFMGPEVALTMFYAQAKGRAYLDGRLEGLTPEAASDYATFTGLAEAIPELIPLSIILKPGVNFFTRVLKGAAAEVIQEEITEALQIGLDQGYLNPDMTWAEARSRLIDAGILATIVGPTQAAIAHPLVQAKEAIQNRPVRQLAEELDREIKATDLSVSEAEIVSKLDPDQFIPENGAQAVIADEVQRGQEFEQHLKDVEAGPVPIPGDRRHDVARAEAGDRRLDVEQRVKVADMTQEELQTALLTSKFGIKNERAYEEAEPLPVQVFVDVDNLKGVNDNMGEAAGDKMLKKVAQALDKETNQAFHISGDEFMIQANTEAEAHETMKRANNRLRRSKITAETPEGAMTKKGIHVTYGLGETRVEAGFNMKAEKKLKQKAGEGEKRGEEPLGITRPVQEPVVEKPETIVKQPTKYKADEKYHQVVPEITSISISNLKQTEFGKVVANPEKFDLSEPIEVSLFASGELKITDGHHRVQAAKQLGIDKLPVKLQAINAKGESINSLLEIDAITTPKAPELPETGKERAQVIPKKSSGGTVASRRPEDISTFDADTASFTAKSGPVNQAGAQYGGFINDIYDPADFTRAFNRAPLRREDILKKFAKAVGTRLYQGRVKDKQLLGFFRPGVDEVRIKNLNDLEVTAHEIAHFLDDKIWNGFGRRRGQKETRPWLHGPNARKYAKELKAVSYDKNKVYEGFAEYIRHWMSRPPIALQRAPEFSKFWNEFVTTNLKYGPALLQAQKDISRWFEQLAIERAASKVGDADVVVNDALDGISDLARQAVFDDLHAILMMETQFTGEKTAVSGGPYESVRLMRGAHAVVDGALRYGPPIIVDKGRWAFQDRDGNLDSEIVDGKLVDNEKYQRWGLRDVLAPVAKELDDWTLYATGLAANELMEQGRENLFKRDEIDAMIDLGRGKPEFKQVFDDYQKWNSAILDFAQQTGILGKEQREKFRRTMYIPFYRVSEGSGITKKLGVEGHIKPIKMLTGGTGNLNDILGNMVKNASGLIVEGIKNQARRDIVTFLEAQEGGKDKIGGGQFLTKISKDTKQVQIDKDQVLGKFTQATLGIGFARYKKLSQAGLVAPEVERMMDVAEANMMDFVKLYMYGQPPKGSNLIAVMNKGKPTFYEVADPMLMRSFEAFNRKHPGGLRRLFSAVRRIGQGSITLTADFMAANIWRDTIHGFVISSHGFVPVIDSLKGIRARMVEDANYRQYIANGGGFSSYLVDPKAFEANMSHFYEKRGIDFKTVLHTPRKMFLALEMIADSFEVSTRLGEVQRSIKQGETPRTAAYSAREVSVDFGMRGDAELLNVMYDTVLFLKAGMNGIDRIYRGFTKDTNKRAIMIKSAGLAAASAVLYSINRGNPCYDDLEDWDKDTHWHIFIPKVGGKPDCNGRYTHVRLPKIWEIGAIASGAERTMELYLDKVENGYADGAEYARRLQQIFVNLFKMEYLPQAVAPAAEVYWLNRNRFTERAIETQADQELLPFARYSPYTNRTLVDLAELTADMPPELQFSPKKAEALIRGYFGTWGMYGLFMSDEMLMGDKLPKWRTDQLPVLRRFTRSHPLRHTQHESEFWDLVREAGMYAKTGKKMIRDEKVKLAEKFIETDPAPLFEMLTSIKKDVKEINNAMVNIHGDLNLTPEQKFDQIAELQGEKNQIYKEIMTDVKGQRGKK